MLAKVVDQLKPPLSKKQKSDKEDGLKGILSVTQKSFRIKK